MNGLGSTRKKQLRRRVFLSLLPLAVIILILRVYPITVAIYESFTNWDGVSQNAWIGLHNYVRFVTDGPFWIILRNTLILLLNVPLQVLVGLLTALLLYEKVVGWRLFRSIVYLPQIISAVIVGYLFSIFFGYHGPFNLVLKTIGLSSLAIQWFGGSYTALGIIILSVVWFSIGWQAIVILGGMSTISPSVFEAAILDGAGYWQRAFKIVFPMLLRVIEFAVIASGVWTLTQLFPFLYSMTAGGPGYETTTFGYMIYLDSFGSTAGADFGTACAIAVMLLVLILILTLVEMRITNRRDDWT